MLDENIVSEARIGKLIQLFRDGGTEHEFLRYGTSLQNFRHLHLESFFEQVVSLVEYQHLDSAQFEVSLDE